MAPTKLHPNPAERWRPLLSARHRKHHVNRATNLETSETTSLPPALRPSHASVLEQRDRTCARDLSCPSPAYRLPQTPRPRFRWLRSPHLRAQFPSRPLLRLGRQRRQRPEFLLSTPCEPRLSSRFA